VEDVFYCKQCPWLWVFAFRRDNPRRDRPSRDLNCVRLHWATCDSPAGGTTNITPPLPPAITGSQQSAIMPQRPPGCRNQLRPDAVEALTRRICSWLIDPSPPALPFSSP
jgi:hypothetical protein